ncbi:MAG: multicopper oxidase domain-containing protein [Gammaproteobacteria bacterium]|nr:multicopper oxidase domain-containing protein [Gammaproteobacteria bacterium]MDH5239797.1 multicopper oxidase domain-containing protein [Gammaproteobacteria bacterium]MDH5260982.1 multicopper oxidase domain-containing protein [Gammaproteobacteria bacterium]MDH5583164.1 multicopper oxidase domain-containing protein [Gammaproteobacteria bacterium]
MINRRTFLRSSVAAALAAGAPLGWAIREAGAAPAAAGIGLADPTLQFGAAGFLNLVPDAMAPGFKYVPGINGEYTVRIQKARQQTGLVDARGKPLKTWVYGYGDPSDGLITWPGRTFEVRSARAGGPASTVVNWLNGLNPNSKKRFESEHLLPVDTSMHWCYSLPGFTGKTIMADGVPTITHLHGGHSDFQFDGNPEFFYNYNQTAVGPQWANVPGGFTTRFVYDNDVPAGNLWYHDHALGITRLNVYAGLAGFYFVRDDDDTGLEGNPLGLPAWPYEKAYAIQDRMFLETGELFYPAYPGDPYYDDFIFGEGANPPPGPSGLAEFFGDHMVVNGVIWPKEDVEPRNYRLRLLNGTDSRFMALQFFEVAPGATDISAAIQQLDFTVIGSDQGLASSPNTNQNLLLSEPGSRYDVVVDFGQVAPGNRVIMWNIGGDEPFGGEINVGQIYSHTDRIMAFDVGLPLGTLSAAADVSPIAGAFEAFGPPAIESTDLTRQPRKVALFEGKDEYGRLQPLLGTAEPAVDHTGAPINWPVNDNYTLAVMPDGTSMPLIGQMEGSIAWHSPTTENPALGSTEEWEIWNMTGDAHPVHLHLVSFKVVDRQEIAFDENTDEDGFLLEGISPADNGVYLQPQPTVQHGSMAGDPATYGMGFRIVHPSNAAHAYGAPVATPEGVVENTPKDMVTALPGQITRIRMTFDKPGRYVWHCHILSHEDHEMMRVLHVGPGA